MRDYAELVKGLRDCSRRNARVCMICGAKASNLCEGTKSKRMFYAADAIEELLAKDKNVPDKNVGKWISVEDEPPKENGRHLVRYKRDVDLGDGETVHEDEIRIMRFFVGEGWRYPIICNDHVRLVNEEVTHWMPLPGPPEESACKAV